MFDNLHLLRPMWLLALVPFIIAYGVWLYKSRASIWTSWIDKGLYHTVMHKVAAAKPISFHLLGLSVVVIVIALAGPTGWQKSMPSFENKQSTVFLLDLSQSMLATDLKPTRLERAKQKINDYLNLDIDGQYGLVVFSHKAFVVSPVTDDKATLLNLLRVLEPSIMPSQGTDLSDAFDVGLSLIQNSGQKNGHLVLLSDESQQLAYQALIKPLTRSNSHLHVLLTSTSEGAPIPLAGGGFANSNGQAIIDKVDFNTLKRLNNNSLRFYRLSYDDSDLLEVQRNIAKSQSLEKQIAEKVSSDTWVDAGPYLLLLILPLWALAYRKGVLFSLFFVICVSGPNTSYAFSLFSHDAKAQRLFEEGQLKEAARTFEDTEWQAASWYKNGDYERAIQVLTSHDTPDSHYNQGNALAKLERIDEAIAAYQMALQMDPEHEDAQYNLDQLLKSDSKEDEKNDDSDSQESDKDNDNNDKSEPEDNQSKDEPESELKPEDPIDEPVPPSQDPNQSWLNQIPDDPGGLLRRKFQFQYKQRYSEQAHREAQW